MIRFYRNVLAMFRIQQRPVPPPSNLVGRYRQCVSSNRAAKSMTENNNLTSRPPTVLANSPHFVFRLSCLSFIPANRHQVLADIAASLPILFAVPCFSNTITYHHDEPRIAEFDPFRIPRREQWPTSLLLSQGLSFLQPRCSHVARSNMESHDNQLPVVMTR